MSRDWKKFNNDELLAMWGQFMNTEFGSFDDPLHFRRNYSRGIRLTPMEIIRLVDELMNRLEVKENPKDPNENE